MAKGKPNSKPTMRSGNQTSQPQLPPANYNFNARDINSYMTWMDQNAPGWRSVTTNPRVTLIRVAQQAGAVGVTWLARTAMDKINGKISETTVKFDPNVEVIDVETASPVQPPGSTNSSSSNDTIVLNSRPVFTTSTNPVMALTPAPTPASVKLNSGVQPDTYVADYQVPVENSCSCMHVSAVTLQIPTVASAANNPLSTYFEKGILFDVLTKMQESVPFSIDTSTLFTTAKLGSAINDAIYALQIYFYYSSIISYESDSRNKNPGMMHLRGLIDATTLSSYVQLGKRLEDIPIPKRVVEWVRFMSGNYYSGATPGSPIIKLVPSQAVLLGATNSADAALTALMQNDNPKIWSILRKARKKWRIGKLYDLPTTPVYNLNFKTIFCNVQNGNRVSGVSTYYNNAASVTTGLTYNTFTNRLDGLAYAMTSYHDTGLATHIPGLCQSQVANATYPDTKYSYYSVSGNKNFYPTVTYPYLALSRDESNLIIGSTVYYPHVFGADKCLGVNGNSLLNSAQAVLDFLFETSNSYGKYKKFHSAEVYLPLEEPQA